MQSILEHPGRVADHRQTVGQMGLSGVDRIAKISQRLSRLEFKSPRKTPRYLAQRSFRWRRQGQDTRWAVIHGGAASHLCYLHAALEDGCYLAEVFGIVERIGVQD